MTIKLMKLVEAYPDGNFDTNSVRSDMFAQAGINYLRICTYIKSCDDQADVGFYAPLPIMHQAIELLLKANASLVDDSFSPKKYGHKTVQIVKDYKAKIDFFSTMAADVESMKLLEGLEQSWLSVRYAEVIVSYSTSDYDDAGNLANRLIDEYLRISGRSPIIRYYNPAD